MINFEIKPLPVFFIDERIMMIFVTVYSNIGVCQHKKEIKILNKIKQKIINFFKKKTSL